MRLAEFSSECGVWHLVMSRERPGATVDNTADTITSNRYYPDSAIADNSTSMIKCNRIFTLICLEGSLEARLPPVSVKVGHVKLAEKAQKAPEQ